MFLKILSLLTNFKYGFNTHWHFVLKKNITKFKVYQRRRRAGQPGSEILVKIWVEFD